MKPTTTLSIALLLIAMMSCNFSNTNKKNLATVKFIVTDSTSDSGFPELNTITSFNSLKMKGVGNIIYEQADSATLTIKGPLNLLDKIIVENHGNELYIYFDPDYKNLKGTKSIYYYITSPQLNNVDIKGMTTFYNEKEWIEDELELSVEGVGEIYAKNIKSRKLNVDMDGVGKIKIDVKCDEINTAIKGIGTIEISGETGIINMNNKGIGKTYISELKILEKENSEK